MKKISLLDYLIRFLCQYLGKKRHFNRSLGVARYPSGLWTLWIGLGKFRFVIKKNGSWMLLEFWTPARSFTIETGFSKFPGFRAHLWRAV
ncbi:hypothetical protein ES702_03093 [subsurface metagenome]